MTDDESDPRRRQLLKAGALAVPAAAAAAIVWSQPTIVQAIAAPMATSSPPPDPAYRDFFVELRSYVQEIPTQWGNYLIEVHGILPTLARVTYIATQPFVPLPQPDVTTNPWLVLSRGAGGGASSGTGPGNTFGVEFDVAAVTLNGAPAPSLIGYDFSEGSAQSWYRWQQPIQPGSVIDLPLITTFPDYWFPDLTIGRGWISLDLISIPTDADPENSRASTGPLDLTVLPPAP